MNLFEIQTPNGMISIKVPVKAKRRDIFKAFMFLRYLWKFQNLNYISKFT